MTTVCLRHATLLYAARTHTQHTRFEQFSECPHYAQSATHQKENHSVYVENCNQFALCRYRVRIVVVSLALSIDANLQTIALNSSPR